MKKEELSNEELNSVSGGCGDTSDGEFKYEIGDKVYYRIKTSLDGKTPHASLNPAIILDRSKNSDNRNVYKIQTDKNDGTDKILENIFEGYLKSRSE